MTTTTTGTCPQCDDKTWTWRGGQPGYDHIHRVRSLPDEEREDATWVLHGFATGFASTAGPGLPQTWVFFEHLEPALVFGRAGRMSVQVTTLYVTGRALDRETGEAKHFARWARGVEPDSADYQAPARRR